MPVDSPARVFLFDPARAPSRAAVDWIAERQAHARVLIPPSLAGAAGDIARLRHEPFTAPDPAAAAAAHGVAAALAADDPTDTAVVESAVLALVAPAAVIVADAGLFRALVRRSCWSMNLPDRPTDGLLVQHLGIASRFGDGWEDLAAEGLDAVLSEDPARLARATRARRLRARREGPERFLRLARRSAGLRPAVVILDLLSPPDAPSAALAACLRPLERERALRLASVAGALFV